MKNLFTKLIKLFIPSLIILTAAGLFFPKFAQAEAFSLVPDRQNIQPQSEVAVNFTVSEANDLSVIVADVVYDPTVLEFQRFSVQGQFADENAIIVADNNPGRLSLYLDLSGTGAGANGTVSAGSIVFLAIADGSTEISFENQEAYDMNFDSLSLTIQPAEIYVSSGDIVPPQIMNGNNLSTEYDFTVNWTTNEPSTSQVAWGESSALGNLTALETGLETEHSIRVEGLSAGYTYYYQAISRDAAGNETKSGIYSVVLKTTSTGAQAVWPVLITHGVKGYIGESKQLSIKNFSQYMSQNVQIEVPYYDNGQMSRRRVVPSARTSSRIAFALPAQSYSGQAEVFVNNQSIGRFDYVVRPQISGFAPQELKVGDVITVSGSGFNPNLLSTGLVIYQINAEGRSGYKIIPVVHNQDLSQVSAIIPAGAYSARLLVGTTHTDSAGRVIQDRSKYLNYKITPQITAVQWTNAEQDSLGSKITVRGTGIAYRPVINFYDSAGNLIDRKSARFESLSENEEAISAYSTKRLSSFRITVQSGKTESDKDEALQFAGDPILSSVSAKYRRTDPASKERHVAARIGDTIRLRGLGFRGLSTDLSVVFSGRDSEIIVPVAPEQLDRYGKQILVRVPEKAISGEISVRLGDRQSAALSLDIVPAIVSGPAEIRPGEEAVLYAKGLSLEEAEVMVQFYGRTRTPITETYPSAVAISGDNVLVRFVVPEAGLADNVRIVLKSGIWTSNYVSATIVPYIESAYLSENNQYMAINGYGFSPSTSGNALIFKRLDGTVIEHRNRVIKVENTELGQVLTARMYTLDTSYDYVAVQVGDKVSNDMRF